MNSASTRRTVSGRRQRSRIRSFVTVLQIGILLSMGAGVGVGLGLFVSLSKALPNISDFEAPEATIVYSSDGEVLGRIFRENRTNVPLKDIPMNLRKATIAIEDKRFYEHSGIDYYGIAAALWADIRTGKPGRGASTITQQLARNVYLTQRKTIQRKIQEAVLAMLIERNFSKNKILELYLNQVFYGSGAFGVQAASKVYFGKDVDQLDLSECATIAGLPQRPSGYSPHEDVEAAAGRRDVVLDKMVEQGFITRQTADEAKAEPLRVIPRRSGRTAYRAAHFVDYVTQRLRERYGDDVLFGGGLRVYTTLNYKMQEAAEKALREGVHKHERTKHVSEGCLISLEPGTGYIRAMVGSVDPNSQFNRCTQAGRQPGSSFKAFVYTAALMSGMRPSDRVLDEPKAFPAGSGKWWNPRNYDGKYHGYVTMERAVAMSMNLAAIRTAEKVGVKKVIEYARLMGIHSPLEPYLPIAIGGVPGLHPIEMASAYCTFANDGIHIEPIAITRVANSRGETIEDFSSQGQQVIPKKISEMMDSMFRAVVTQGTGRSVADVPEARGKTGTTNNDVDAWFLGYIPHKLVTAVWVGNDNSAPMSHAFGGTVCAPIWEEYMRKAIPIYDEMKRRAAAENQPKIVKKPKEEEPAKKEEQTKEKTPTDTQADVTTTDGDLIKCKICDESQLLATKACPSWHNEEFVRGSEPTSYCDIHRSDQNENPPAPDETRRTAPASDTQYVTVTVCSESGLLAGKYCPKPERKRFPADEIPTQVCNIHDRTRE